MPQTSESSEYRHIRVYHPAHLYTGASPELDQKHWHYLHQVMRLKVGDVFLLFNGTDGEYFTQITSISRKDGSVLCQTQRRAPAPSSDIWPDIWLVITPLKNGRTEWVIEKACELGATRIIPVLTERTIVTRINTEKWQATLIEASEQCERLDVPEIAPLQRLTTLLQDWSNQRPNQRPLLYGDETGNSQSLKQVLAAHTLPLAWLVGPEGGFSPAEHALLSAHTACIGTGLGSRILRADTAALNGLSIIQALCGDDEQAGIYMHDCTP